MSGLPERFAVVADFSTTPASSAVASLVEAWEPGFIVTTGDHRYGTDKYADTVGRLYSRFTATNAFLPSVGNHDHDDGDGTDGFANYFDVPRRQLYYHARRGMLCFFLLDSTTALRESTSYSAQHEWLEKSLRGAHTKCQWKFVVLHHSPFSSSAMYGSNILLQWPFGLWGAHVVLSSHSHTYERIQRGQVMYLVNGLGGYSSHLFDKSPVEGSVTRFHEEFGATVIDATNATLRMRFVTLNGSFTDDVTVRANDYSLDLPPAPPPVPLQFDCSAVPRICGGPSHKVEGTCLRWAYCDLDILYDASCEECDDECEVCRHWEKCGTIGDLFSFARVAPMQAKLKLLTALAFMVLCAHTCLGCVLGRRCRCGRCQQGAFGFATCTRNPYGNCIRMASASGSFSAVPMEPSAVKSLGGE